MNTLERPLLIHYHIFKNAGSSVDVLLKKAFGTTWKPFEGSKSSSILKSHSLISFLEANPSVQAVSSHQLRPPLPTSHSYPVVLLRHPIDRLRSVFNFVYKSPGQPGHGLAKERGFRGYVAWALEGPHGGRTVVRDYQVNHLSDASFRSLHMTNERDLEQAKQFLLSWGVFGIVRRFAESMQLFERVYKPIFPNLNLYDVSVNTTNRHFISDAHEMEDVRRELGNLMFERIVGANMLDMELYEFAQAQFDVWLSQLEIVDSPANDLASSARTI